MNFTIIIIIRVNNNNNNKEMVIIMEGSRPYFTLQNFRGYAEVFIRNL
jgi:hypothetical protein